MNRPVFGALPGSFHGEAAGVRVQGGIVQLSREGPVAVEVLRPGETTLLLLEVQTSERHELTVELWRGEQRRHSWVKPVQGRALVGFRLSWSAAPQCSTRLRCRVLVDGREAACQTVLLGMPEADAQGRLPVGGTAPPSPATLLAHQEVLLRQLERGKMRRLTAFIKKRAQRGSITNEGESP